MQITSEQMARVICESYPINLVEPAAMNMESLLETCEESDLGDTLFLFCVRELNDAGDNGSFDTADADRMLETAIRDLQAVRAGIHTLDPALPTDRLRIIVEVSGGCCVNVYCSERNADVDLIDWDNAKDEDDGGTYAAECEKLSEEAKHLHVVF